LIEFREISHAPEDAALLRRFYDSVYVPDFPNPDERESLPNMLQYLQRKADGWYGANNYHILLGCLGGEPVAGSITDYLAEPNAGVGEFIAVAPTCRQSGVGRELVARTEALLAADAQRAHGRDLDCIVAEMNDPFKLDPSEDSLDPFLRAAIWDRFGFRKLDFPYLQPALSAEQSPVSGLFLIAKTFRPDYAAGLPSEIVKSVLRGYLRWAMRIDDPEHCAEYQQMVAHIDRRPLIPLLSLAAYIGRDAARPLVVRDIEDAADPDIEAIIAVYAAAFPGGPTDIDPNVFRTSVTRHRRPDAPHRYHLWAIRSAAEAPVEGMTSFFTFPSAGFGGYITLGGALRGTGRFRLLLARMEEQMVRDHVGARGWTIECDPEDEALFARNGFRTVDFNYRQPSLPGRPDYGVADSPPLCLMYKRFGRNFEVPVIGRAQFLIAIEDILRTVYRVGDVAHSPFYLDMSKQASRWPQEMVQFR
jgi:GNAT superfamily N-acetyltransferase